MEAPRKTWRSRRVLIAIAVVLVIAGATSSYLVYSAHASPSTRCDYVPGNNLYLHVVSSNSTQSTAGLGVRGSLTELCPVGGTGTPPPRPKSTVLGTWSFVTNSTGWVSVPSSDLAGWSLTFNVAYDGHAYQFDAMICGGGETTVELSLPSGLVNGTTSGGGSTLQLDNNGTQIVQNCGVGSFTGNATIS